MRLRKRCQRCQAQQQTTGKGQEMGNVPTKEQIEEFKSSMIAEIKKINKNEIPSSYLEGLDDGFSYMEDFYKKALGKQNGKN